MNEAKVETTTETEIPSMPLDKRTRIIDSETNETITDIDGVVVPPIGAVIQLAKPNRDATVVGVRVLAGPNTALVVLDVTVERVGRA